MLWVLLVVLAGVLLLAVPVGVIVLWVLVVRLTRRLDALEARIASVPATRPAAAAPSIPTPPPVPLPVAARQTEPAVRARAGAGSSPRATQPHEWEVVVGTNWLNKIGVLVFVLGVGFLIAYSFANVGPAGRIALGYAIGAALLGAGVVLERRTDSRTYGYGLVAGGWAAIYFTTFAMHGVPAARLIESEAIGVLVLIAVAAAMIAHSLRYRSQTVTGLAYVVAYGTLAITPLSGFSAAAAVPLTASLLVVSARLRWPGVTVVGLVSTYLVFAIREQISPSPTFDPAGLARYLILGTYWLLFEAADIVARLDGRAGTQTGNGSATTGTLASAPVPLMALNAMGLLGTMLIQVPVDDPRRASLVIGGAAAAYLASALVRAALGAAPAGPAGQAAGGAFTSIHGAVAVSAALFAWTAVLRFAAPHETLVFLLEAQLIVGAGVALGDAALRRIGAWTAVFASLGAARLALSHLPTMTAAMPIVLLVAAAWYANDTWLRRRGAPAGVERSYTWIALALIGLVIAIEVPPAWEGLAALLVSALLLERALRDPRDYREQAFLTAAIGVIAILQHFALEPGAPAAMDVRTVLPLAAVLCYALAWRIGEAGPARAWHVNQLLGGTLMSWAATTVVAVMCFRALPEAAVGLAWMAVAIACALAGLWRRAPALRWQGYVLAGVAGLHAALPLLPAAAQATRARLAGATAALAFVFAVVVRRGLSGNGAGAPAEERRAVSVVVAIGIALGLLVARAMLPAASLTAAWAAIGMALLVVGFLWRERVLRFSGLSVLLVCLVKLFGYDLQALEPLGRIISFVVLGMVLLAVSWGYTRYRSLVERLFEEKGGPEDQPSLPQ